MFWRFGGYASISTLDSILDKPDVTVEELLDESDLIQELKQQNSKLIEFLRDESVLTKLLDYVVAETPSGVSESNGGEDVIHPDEEKERTPSAGISFFGRGMSQSRSKSFNKRDGDGETEHEKREAQRKKYAYVACELLSSEVWSITEALMENSEHLRQFWQYMRRPAPLDPLQAGYFTKVNESLLDKKTEEMLAFFKSLPGIIPAMLQHVDCPMVMDLLLKIVSLEKHEGGMGIVDWLQSQDLIPLLLGYLSPEHNSATQTSAGDFLKAIITISANATTQDQSVIGPNELTRQLVSETCIRRLIADMLRGGNPLTVGVGIIIEVIRKNNSDYDMENHVGPDPKTSDPIYLGTLLRQFAEHVPDFMHLVRSRSAKKPDLKAAFGSRIEPLGFDRFKTCELMAELLHCSNMGLLNEPGTETDVKKRDAEREKLKAEGKLVTPKPPQSPNQDGSHDEFGSSVDSHGFHLAERPSDDEMNGRPDEMRRLEVQNVSDEDGFEKVNVPSGDDLPDEVSFDELNEKAEQASLPALEKVERRDQPTLDTRTLTDPDAPKPLSPLKRKSNLPHFDPPPSHAVAHSPTTAGVIDQIDRLDVDEDSVMTEFGEEPIDSDDDGPSELERHLARHAEDKPAPLFVRKEAPSAGADDPQPESEDQQDIDQSIATIQGDQSMISNGKRPQYETEADGNPVVGDLLKIQFVEHQVVPTILDFFFRFPWNNFLHNVVYDVVQQVFNGTLDRGYNRTLAIDLFTTVQAKDGQSEGDLGLVSTKDITDRILDGQRASDESQSHKGMRLGFMGHLTLIAEEVCKFGNRHPPESLDPVILDQVNREEWIQYVEGTLAETRDKDNAVLGGVRPQDSVGVRPMGMGVGGLQAGFTPNTANTLASAGIGSGIAPQDSLAMSEGTVGESFEINKSGMGLSGFGDDDDDEEMEFESTPADQGRGDKGGTFSDDDQGSPESKSGQPYIPPPLNVPPSRARRQLAARLAQKKKEAADAGRDPDAADAAALEVASHLPDEPREGDVDLAPAAARDIEETGLQITGLRTVSGISGSASRFSGLFSSSDSDDSSDEGGAGSFDEDGAGRDVTLARDEGDFEDDDDPAATAASRGAWATIRRQNTTEAKERTPLDDGDDDDDEEAADLASGADRTLSHRERDGGPFADPGGADGEDADSSDEDDLVEMMRPRRIR